MIYQYLLKVLLKINNQINLQIIRVFKKMIFLKNYLMYKIVRNLQQKLNLVMELIYHNQFKLQINKIKNHKKLLFKKFKKIQKVILLHQINHFNQKILLLKIVYNYIKINLIKLIILIKKVHFNLVKKLLNNFQQQNLIK